MVNVNTEITKNEPSTDVTNIESKLCKIWEGEGQKRTPIDISWTEWMSQVYEELEEENKQTTFQEEASNISKIISVVWAQRNNNEWSEELAEIWKYQEVSSPITFKQKKRLISVFIKMYFQKEQRR